ncbi:class I SAM-dependent methyltransferase [Saccharothrix luteola]|uniref:class I SAM-dependent methyltransferase n=1 Tax=Saccharothrix luteola TaxID=2893018 RepID=UPI001E5FA7CA|nr:50S ribosomal protein L11 methyltransferase [Saccharothrix luteola]MCC8245959.1 50S ribosomal protein L11 methyltransferase [Saccharothrix luteola]MCC8248281.1 50S ribosomal protein L11 methyltransferase [Saccharothrix luteola]
MISGPVEDFVRSVTSARPVPLTPDIVLRTADDVIALWERTGSPEPPFWAFPWAGGQALARHVLDHPELVAGRRVLDLASGSGLVAVAAARAGGLVTANDIDPVAVAAIDLNARANDVTVTIAAGDLLDTDPEVDVLLAGDVFYDRDMAARVEPFLLAAHRRGALVLVGDPQRSFLPRGWTLVDAFPVPVPPDLEGVAVRTTSVWRL